MFRKKYLFIIFIVLLLGTTLLLLALSRSSGIDQPIAYNHKLHIETVGLSCSDCHVYASIKPSAGIPSNETCQSCHSETPLTDSSEELKLLQFISENKEIPWKVVHNVPDHVYFSHRRHVVGGDMSCSDCHGKVEEMTRPISVPTMKLTMEECMDCHKQKNITNDCLACHR